LPSDALCSKSRTACAPSSSAKEAIRAWQYENGSYVRYNGSVENKQNALDIIDVYYLERIFDTYGEPYYTWIDKGHPNENGEKKAEWYTNLFNRMKEGHQVLEDGLASSPQWIKYALESGLVVMEQVDKTRTWNKFTYTNCADITEQTDNLAVARAEAEYKRNMNKIESKDKRFDLELKNIDTEHNSLQTEYDSIKSVIDKNVERNFKLYS